MQVRAKVDCFVEGSYRVKDEVFPYSDKGPKNDNLEVVKTPPPPEEEKEK